MVLKPQSTSGKSHMCFCCVFRINSPDKFLPSPAIEPWSTPHRIHALHVHRYSELQSTRALPNCAHRRVVIGLREISSLYEPVLYLRRVTPVLVVCWYIYVCHGNVHQFNLHCSLQKYISLVTSGPCLRSRPVMKDTLTFFSDDILPSHSFPHQEQIIRLTFLGQYQE